jgi:AcrR family transcriptional regulator
MAGDEGRSTAAGAVGEEAALFGSDRRGRLLAAAAQVFAEKGYRATSMNDLAEAVGISKPTLYHYVASKQQLLVELYEAVMSGSLYQVGRVSGLGLSAADALRTVLVERIVYICRHARLIQIFVEEESELPPAMTESVRKIRTEREDTFVRILERGMADGSFAVAVDPRVAARAIIGALTYVYKWYEPDGPKTPVAVAQELSDYLVTGLTAPAGRPSTA